MPMTELRGDVRAAAQLARVVADLDDPHLVAVLLAEHRDRADAPGLGLVGDEPAHLEVAQQDLVDLVLDLAEYDWRHRRRGLEVEAQPPGRVQRTGLGRAVAERAAQAGVQQVRGRVAARDRRPPVAGRPAASTRSPGRTSPESTVTRCVIRPGQRLLHVDDRQLGLAAAGVDRDAAPVGLLAAALGVERGRVEHDLDVVALAGGRQQPGVADDRRDDGLAGDLEVAGEVGRLAGVERRRGTARGRRAPVFFAWASALARARCSAISRRKPASSTAMPCSAAISRVRSIGNP